MKIAVPGTMTTAYLALKLYAPDAITEVVPFDQIIPRVLEGKYEAGLIIHEGQLTFDRQACTALWTWESGGAKRPACRCRWAGMPSAAILARS